MSFLEGPGGGSTAEGLAASGGSLETDSGPVRELTLLAALTGRCDALAASGLLEAALKAATGWAFTNRSLTAAVAYLPFSESIHWASCLLGRFRHAPSPSIAQV